MAEKCITLDNMLYKNKHYRVNKIIFVDEKDAKRLEGQGAIKRLERPKPIIHSVTKYPYTKKPIESIKESIESIKRPIKSIKKPIKSKRGKEKYAYTKT